MGESLNISATPGTKRTRRTTHGATRRRRGGIAIAPHYWRRLVTGRWLIVTIVILIAAGVMIRLGIWQLHRLEGRRAANAAITRQLAAPPLPLDSQTAAAADPATLTFRRVSLSGTWDYAHEVELRYRSFDGQAGIHVLTPLRLDGGGTAVLVDRGWIPYQEVGPDGRRAYQHDPRGAIEGLVNESHSQGSTSAEPGVFSQIDVPAIGAQIPYPLVAYWVQRLPSGDNQNPPRSEGLPDLSDGTHLAYMVQWWAFAATLLVTYLIFANQSMKKSTKLEAGSTK